MKKGEGNSWIGLLVSGILIFGATGAFLFYKLDTSGFFEDTNSTIIGGNNNNSLDNNLNNTNNTLGSDCSLSWARWEKNGFETSVAKEGELFYLSTYGEKCFGRIVTVNVYEDKGNADLLVRSFSAPISGNSAKVSLTVDNTFHNGSRYYFVSSLDGNSAERVVSPNILISNPSTTTNLKDPLLCDGYGDDRDYLYNVNVNVFSKANGRQTFTADLDGKLLRTNNTAEDRFFVDNSNGALQITYSVNPSCGGLDIVYHVANPSSASQLLPDFIFAGFNQPRVNPRYVDLLRGGNVVSAGSKTVLYASYYPSSFIYSPITMAISDDLAQGSSIQYPFLDYRVETIPQMSWELNGDIRYRYVFTTTDTHQKASISPGASQTYTVSLRFSPSRYWLLTLDPYKKFFDSTYGSLKSTSKDMGPVVGISESYTSYVSATNPRGYVDWYVAGKRLDTHGWADEVTRILGSIEPKGYKRLMLWNTAGLYDPAICSSCNFPPAFMDWLPKLVETQTELNRIKQAGISLGYWWGRSAQIPVPDQWPPSSLVVADYFNSAHKAFLNNQLSLAKQRGSDMIGLDTFSAMEPYGRSKWLDEMRSGSSIKFIHEHGGADIFHTRSANFYTDNYVNGNWDTLSGPSILSLYLNPKSEVWAYEVVGQAGLNSLGQAGMKARAEKLAKWGYTYIDNGAFLDVTGLDLTVSPCLDGKDNDGDGKVDWPRDDGCTDEFDESE